MSKESNRNLKHYMTIKMKRYLRIDYLSPTKKDNEAIILVCIKDIKVNSTMTYEVLGLSK